MLNSLLVAAMPLAPRFLVKAISKRYIAGEDLPTALEKCKQLHAEGFVTTMDILGEAITSLDQADDSREAYLDLIDQVAAAGIDRNISLKPTALGLSIDAQQAAENIRQIVTKAHATDTFIRIDMEDSPYTQATLDIYRDLKKEFPRIGTVIQAYLHRSADDVQTVAEMDGNLRICKGIYRESPEIAYQLREEVRENFRRLITIMLEKRAYVGIATHDKVLIQDALNLISELDVPADCYEFQALLGVPIEETLHDLIKNGHKVRIYVPFGSQWYAYSSRRLKENPNIAGYVIKDLFRR